MNQVTQNIMIYSSTLCVVLKSSFVRETQKVFNLSNIRLGEFNTMAMTQSTQECPQSKSLVDFGENLPDETILQ